MAAEGRFHPQRTRDQPIRETKPQTRRRRQADAAIECINCAVCYAACDTVAASPDYLGPAALNRAWSLLNDDKDSGTEAILAAAGAKGGCHSCHAMGSCTRFCPNELDPMASIAGLKRASIAAALKRKG